MSLKAEKTTIQRRVQKKLVQFYNCQINYKSPDKSINNIDELVQTLDAELIQYYYEQTE